MEIDDKINDLERRLDGFEHNGLHDKTAHWDLYHRIIERFSNPQTEKDLLLLQFHPCLFSNFFDGYFALHPKEARTLLDAHNKRYFGWEKIIEPFAYFFNPLERLRYKSAKRMFSMRKQNDPNK